MEQTANKDQDPPHGGSFVRRDDGSLVLRENTKPAGDAAAAINPEPQPAAPAADDQE